MPTLLSSLIKFSQESAVRLNEDPSLQISFIKQQSGTPLLLFCVKAYHNETTNAPGVRELSGEKTACCAIARFDFAPEVSGITTTTESGCFKIGDLVCVVRRCAGLGGGGTSCPYE